MQTQATVLRESTAPVFICAAQVSTTGESVSKAMTMAANRGQLASFGQFELESMLTCECGITLVNEAFVGPRSDADTLGVLVLSTTGETKS